MKLMIKTWVFLAVVALAGSAYASIYGGAVGQMKYLLAGEQVQKEDSAPSVTGEGTSENQDNDNKSGNVSVGCGPEAVLPVETCEIGQGLLCTNTPSFSVSGDEVVIKGTVDRRTNAFSHIKVYAQHEYTKDFTEIEIERWAESDCWQSSWTENYDGCLDREGYFGVVVPLKELGPYTILIDAVSLDGDAVSKTVRTSKVVPVKLASEDIKIEPDPAANNGIVSAGRVNLKVDLLHGCSNCDFFGTSTGGVMITVTNTIHTKEGGIKNIERSANIASGGVFDICVPAIEGKNNLKVKACNAASADECSVVDNISYEVASGDVEINLVYPDQSKVMYDSGKFDIIPLIFTIKNYDHNGGACKDGDVVVKWDRYDPVSLCPDSEGRYTARLIPQYGINTCTIDVNTGSSKISESFIVGWGRVVNPYTTSDAGWIEDGLEATIGADFINDNLRPAINNFLNSDNLSKFISILTSGGQKNEGGDETKADTSSDDMNKIKGEIENCSSGGGLSGMKMELVGDPVLKKGELQRFEFADSEAKFSLNLEGLEARIRLYKDENGDGKPDSRILPLLISLRGAVMEGKIKMVKKDGSAPLFLLTSDHTDCDFMSAAYCKKRPAFLIPQNLVGGATKGGSFVRCDDKGQQIDSETDEDCTQLNILNAQTGVLNQKVLDVINDLAYCQGSAFLTYLMREKMKDLSFDIGCSGDDCGNTGSILGNKTIHVNTGVDIGRGNLVINNTGIYARLASRFGSDKSLALLDPAVANGQAGILVNPEGGVVSERRGEAGKLSFSIDMDLINELLFQLAFQKPGNGLLDWEVDEKFFNSLGFDYVEQCDAFEPTPEVQTPSALCQLRPRVMEMLGSALTTNGYFGNKHPLRMKLRGSRRIAPMMKLYETQVPYELPPEPGQEEIKYEYRPGTVLELQLPDIEISFYALEVDESAGQDIYGNPQMLLDRNGNPVIHSMVENSKDDVPIIKVKATVLIPLEVGSLVTADDEPEKLMLTLRPIPQLFKIAYQKISGGNATMIGDEALLSSFTEKIKFGVEIYGKPEKPLKLKLPKSISLISQTSADPTDIFSLFGLERLIFGTEGLSLGFDTVSERINLDLSPSIEQNL